MAGMYFDHDMANELATAITNHAESEGFDFEADAPEKNSAMTEFMIIATAPDGRRFRFAVQVRDMTFGEF